MFSQKSAQMNLLKKLFRIKIVPQETVVPDELVKHYPDPPKKLQTILQRVPNTAKLLYQYNQANRHCNISTEWKYWAYDMLENGFETSGIIRLAGEDLNMDPFAFDDLLASIFGELDIDIKPELAYCAYAVSIAEEALRGERTAKNGFEILSQAAISTGYHEAFMVFYYQLDEADLAVWLKYTKGSGLRMDNVEEWMNQFFEKFVQANIKYSSIPTNTQG